MVMITSSLEEILQLVMDYPDMLTVCTSIDIGCYLCNRLLLRFVNRCPPVVFLKVLALITCKVDYNQLNEQVLANVPLIPYITALLERYLDGQLSAVDVPFSVDLPIEGVFASVSRFRFELVSALLAAERKARKNDWLDGFRAAGLPGRLKGVVGDPNSVMGHCAVAGALLTRFYADVYEGVVRGEAGDA